VPISYGRNRANHTNTNSVCTKSTDGMDNSSRMNRLLPSFYGIYIDIYDGIYTPFFDLLIVTVIPMVSIGPIGLRSPKRGMDVQWFCGHSNGDCGGRKLGTVVQTVSMHITH
jgi:hypothetical protein